MINLFIVLLTVLFIGLKLTGNVKWNWFWVLSPILIPIILGVVGGMLIFVFGGAASMF